MGLPRLWWANLTVKTADKHSRNHTDALPILRHKQGQVVNCPDCETPFMISPNSPEMGSKCEEPANGPQYGFGFTPEADR